MSILKINQINEYLPKLMRHLFSVLFQSFNSLMNDVSDAAQQRTFLLSLMTREIQNNEIF